MFDIGWSEMAIIALVIMVVLGPKELPHALKTVSHWMRAARKLGSEFQSGVNEIVRDAELEDAKKQLQGISKHSIEKKIEKAIDPAGDLKKAMKETEDATKTAAPAAAAPVVAPAAPPPVEAPAVAAPATAPAASSTPMVEKITNKDADSGIVERT
ncbi:MAG: twin-arginine translocase subunit TatB [Rhodospirillaceae bacterium]|nr:twin-arginine translocase subunit TatB [Rhodospirillaceae bacterium]